MLRSQLAFLFSQPAAFPWLRPGISPLQLRAARSDSVILRQRGSVFVTATVSGRSKRQRETEVLQRRVLCDSAHQWTVHAVLCPQQW